MSTTDLSLSHASLAIDIWRLAWPAIVRNSLNCAADRVTLAFVGHYDSDPFHYDGAGLGKMYSNITGLSIGMGACLGLATLCSQAHGAGRSEEVNGLYLRRCLVVLAIAFLYSASAAFMCERVLIAISMNPDVARCSARYAQVQLIGVPFFWVATAVQTVCDGLQDTRPGMYAGLVSAAAQVAMCAIAVHPALLDMGYLGMAAARSAGGVVQIIVLCGIVICQGRQAQVAPMPVPNASHPAGQRQSDRIPSLRTRASCRESVTCRALSCTGLGPLYALVASDVGGGFERHRLRRWRCDCAGRRFASAARALVRGARAIREHRLAQRAHDVARMVVVRGSHRPRRPLARRRHSACRARDHVQHPGGLLVRTRRTLSSQRRRPDTASP